MRRDLADRRDVYFFYLAVISYANSTCKTEERQRRRRLVPQNFFHSVSYVRFVIKTFADDCLLASNLGISFFPSYRFGVADKGNSIVLERYPGLP